MESAVAVVSGVLIVAALVLLGVRLTRQRSDRRFEGVALGLETKLQEMSVSVAEAIDQIAELRDEGPRLPLTLDLDTLANALVAEAAARTGAEAAVLRVEGPGRRPVVAAFGPGVESEVLDGTFGPPNARAFGAATIGWTYPPLDVDGPTELVFRSSLAIPVTEGSAGTLAVYSTAADAFRREHATALQALAEEAGVGLANARRFGEVEARTFVDPATGVPNRRGYELELERKITHARRTGRPLSVMLVALAQHTDSSATERSGNGVGTFARLLTRVTRGSDVPCRRGENEFAILLPETPAKGAGRLTSRLREEVQRTFGGIAQSTFAVGLAEWRRNEPGRELDARAAAALARPLTAVATVQGSGASRLESTPRASTGDLEPDWLSDLRLDALGAITTAISDVRRLGRPLAVAVLAIDELDTIVERDGREVANSVLGEVVEELDRSVEDGVVHRLGPCEFALVLAGSTVGGAEVLLGALHSSLDTPPDVERITFSAGTTQLGPSDDAQGVLGRAERALRQARQVGAGTIVVVLPGSSTG